MRIAVTPGDPAGVGPDVLLRVAAEGAPAALVAYADPAQLAARAARLGLDVRLADDDGGADAAPGLLRVRPVPLADPADRPGRADPANAPALLAALEAAVRDCMAGRCAALVTGPLAKAMVAEGTGHPFTGHTEHLATLTGGVPVMMLVADALRVALATTHLPLRAVPDALDREGLARTLRVMDRDLRARFRIEAPRILVCGLNPHAGEAGCLGDEETRVIAPAIALARKAGVRATGPIPADTAFTPARLAGCDAVLAMYHDQGLPVIKHAAFERAVNVTLGLPIVRTSVDHGTAYELAGSGRADAGSFRAAVELAARLAA
ncbi:MAG TPA: 4-hydroxythreonine-4-phosphate dehydrogenase PdxA [Chromatiales bacterium]|nr:4-hydroxythreonine-4-phosphate dehydrogenase PdxA [Chromatiales bacterium]